MSESTPIMKYYVMCVDDDADFLASLADPLERALDRQGQGYDCECVFLNSAAEALDFAEKANDEGGQCALVITDQRMPETTGLEMLGQMREMFPHAARVLLTGYAGLESARTAINKHLLDRYISKPITDLNEFSATVVGLINEFHLHLITRHQQEALEEKVSLLEDANDRISRTRRAGEQVAYFTQGLGTLDLDEILYQTVSKIPQLFGASHALLLDLDSDCKIHLLRRFGRGCRDSRPCFKSLSDVLKNLVHWNQPCLVQEFPKDSKKEGTKVLQVIIPLHVHSGTRSGDVTGDCSLSSEQSRPDTEKNSKLTCRAALCMCCPSEGEQERQIEEIRYKASLVRDIIGTNLSHAVAYAESQRLSRYDSMTGLFMRRVFEDRLAQACQESRRYRRPLSVAMLDLDNFKTVNDTFGHLTGDVVLEEVGQLIRDNMRSCDVAARYGGDEFAILLPDTSPAGVQRLVERLREEIAEHSFSCNHLNATVSIGVATFDPEADKDGLDFLHRADWALYKAKDSGRNAVRHAGVS